ncbi:PRD domain-containing protein [Clostridium frigidicarnis]|uniref:PRD domain protein EF_0829/AHA_3910 n=1 Tax=Clostridium frigidicarnis TaxID=84698 RepID=A0A1I0ZNR2_9CLOT|nr:PRD domain-containing protein [Clostridium frigidicarnis]SFB25813.1 PRD domain protein EF_0829/AHA_3910 [Clostridium frigidicarnis]
MDLIVRLNILRDAGQVSEKTYNQLLKVIRYFKEKRNIELTEENGAMLITHLSSALARIEKNELVNSIEEIIFEEIKKDINYKKVVEITDDMEETIGKLPREERDFIEMHICTLLNK